MHQDSAEAQKIYENHLSISKAKTLEECKSTNRSVVEDSTWSGSEPVNAREVYL